MSNPQKQSAASPQEAFNAALMNALASQRDGYANAAAETAAKLAITQGAMAELSKELAQARSEVKALVQKLEGARPAAGESEGSTQD